MKKRILIFAAFLLTLMFTLGLSAIATSAEESEPRVSIEKFNLAFENDTHLKYAVKFTGIEDSEINANNIGMLYWTDYEGGFVPGTESYSSKTTGYTIIDGEKYYTFEYDKLAAKQLTDYIYSVAYLEYNGETYYSAPVKYSALEYAYNRLGKTSEGTTNEELKALLNNMLAYGASAQQYFDYKEDRLATSDFFQLTLVGGTLADGFDNGLYLSTDEITITAPEIDGKSFVGWQNAAEEIIYTDNPATLENLTSNTTLTAIYEDAVRYSEGLEFTSNGDGTCSVSDIGTCMDTDIVIPTVSPDGDSVTGIGYRAFFKSSITSIEIPNSVTKIASETFYDCDLLVSVVIPDSVINIGWGAFQDCDLLVSVVLGKNVSTIDSQAFLNCYKLVEIVNNSSLQISKGSKNYGYIAQNALEVHSAAQKVVNQDGFIFYTYDGVNHLIAYTGNNTDIILPDSYNNENYLINQYAFYACDKIESIKISKSVTSIGKCAFKDCNMLSTVEMSDGVTDIYTSAFYSCDNLSTLVLSNTLTYVAGSAFGDCLNLQCNTYDNALYVGNPSNPYLLLVKAISKEISTCVINPKTKFINYCAFSHCENLGNIEIPDSVIVIGESAFSSCVSFTQIRIPDSVTIIETSSFRECNTLVSITIGKNVKSIGDGAFTGCYKLAEVINKSTLGISTHSPYYGGIAYTALEVHKGESNIVNVNGYLFYPANWGINYLVSYVGNDSNAKLPESYNGENYVIHHYSFAYCNSIVRVVIPNTVTSIDKYAFTKCNSLVSVKIPMSITSIGNSAFSYCKLLSSIEIPNSVTNIDAFAFYDCSSLKNIYYTGNEEDWATITIGSSNSPLTNATRYYYSETAPTTEGNFWHYVDGVPTVWPEYIAPTEPAGSEGLSFTLSDDGTYYIVNGYGSCSDANVIIPNVYDGLPVTHIASGAFTRADMMGMESVYIPASITNIDSGAFVYCLLKNIEVSENNPFYKSIGSDLYTKDGKTLILYAAYNYRNDFYVPDGVETISNSAFMQSSIKNVVLADSVTTICESAFFWCESLKTVTVSKNVTSIGNSAFANCSYITDVYYTGTEEEWSAITIGTSNDYLTNATIHYNYTPEE